jgi:BMFP domain-containing protein YqiC
MQTRNPFFDELAKLATGAAGVAQGMGEEARAFWRAQVERIIADMDLVRRDEYEALKELATNARREAEALKVRLDALEAATAADEPAQKPRTSRKKST